MDDADALLAQFHDEITKVGQGAVVVDTADTPTQPNKRMRTEQTVAVVAASSSHSFRKPEASALSRSHVVSSVVASAKPEPVGTISIDIPAPPPQHYDYSYYQASAAGGVEAATAHLEAGTPSQRTGVNSIIYIDKS
jgi:hypothetical protein